MRLLTAVTTLIFGMFVTQVYAEPLKYIDGKEYQQAPQSIVNNPAVQDYLKQGNGKVQVLEFFSYACSWCYKLDPFVEVWSKKLAKKGAVILISNHDTPFTREIYHGAKLHSLQVTRSISCHGKTRHQVPEIIAYFER